MKEITPGYLWHRWGSSVTSAHIWHDDHWHIIQSVERLKFGTEEYYTLRYKITTATGIEFVLKRDTKIFISTQSKAKESNPMTEPTCDICHKPTSRPIICTEPDGIIFDACKDCADFLGHCLDCGEYFNGDAYYCPECDEANTPDLK